MTGETKLIITHATMVEALQFYLDSKILRDDEKQRVALVEKEGTTSGEYSKFMITMLEKSKENS